MCGLLGGNGAGKTTTIGMIMGLILPTSGQALVLGADMATERHRVLGRMNFESPYVDMPHRLTVRQNLDVFARALRPRRPPAPASPNSPPTSPSAISWTAPPAPCRRARRRGWPSPRPC